METKKCRLSYLRGDSQTAGQLNSAAGDALLLPEYITNPLSAQISENCPVDILRPMIALARRRGDWAIWAALVELGWRWEGQS